MSARATWKGVLQISQVQIPIKVYPATEASETLSFHQLHEACQTRVTQRKWCTTCAREVPAAEVMKGFEFEKGRYVLLNDAELDAVKPPSTRVIDLVQFANASDVGPLYLDRAYYLAPDGPLAVAAYALFRDALDGLVGVGKVALYGREYLVAVRSQYDVLMLYTLHHAAEIRASATIDDLGTLPPRAPRAEYKLARQLLEQLTHPLNLSDFIDAYQVDVRRLIDAKIAGKEIIAVAPVDAPAVVNLRDALTASLQACRAATTIPAKAKPVKRMRAS